MSSSRRDRSVSATRGLGRGGNSRASGDRPRLRRPRTAGTTTYMEPNLKRPPSPQRSAPPSDDIEALEEALLISIRTAGLKRGRENQLVEEAGRLRRRRKEWLEDTKKVLLEWVTHASLIWELHEKELSKLADDRREGEKRHARSLAQLTKQLTEDQERVCTAATNEREAAAVQLRAAQEAHELWKQAHREEISTVAREEIASTTTRLRRDAEQQARSTKESLEVEYANRLATTVAQNEELAVRINTAEEKSTRLEGSKRRLEAQLAEVVERTRRMDRMSKTHNGVLEREKADLERRAERFAHRVEEERALKEKERLAHESRVRAIRTQWKEELLTVDERVRSVIGTKDQTIKELVEELETLRGRAKTAETLLEELQVEICPAKVPPSSRENASSFKR